MEISSSSLRCGFVLAASSEEMRPVEKKVGSVCWRMIAKAYGRLLLTLPPELRESAIQYRQLKKIINQIVAELTALRLSPGVLQAVIQPPEAQNDKGKQREDYQRTTGQDAHSSPGPRVIYELVHVADHLEPRLRVYLDQDADSLPLDPSSSAARPSDVTVTLPMPHDVLQLASASATTTSHPPSIPGIMLELVNAVIFSSHELIIPLPSDTAFFRTLSHALDALSANLVTKRADFDSTLHALSHDISAAPRPWSSTSVFRSPFSSDPPTISVSSDALATSSKSDFETWRHIFQLHVEADIFQGHQERFKGSALGALKLELKKSRVVLNTFFPHVTSEATRKILKKHAKRTPLPLSPDLASPITITIPTRQRRARGRAPADPIRLRRTHLFCIRCIAKLQKRAQEHCPMCQAATVLSAARCELTALRTWTKERAAAEEEMQELGLAYRGCVAM
ncbi:hypothetical protein C8Q76DRAFT_765147 [Earliella scabrosa]|nr:hypothetical protein C8Q76DRAFT_765147 [Earliella scabrosa]